MIDEAREFAYVARHRDLGTMTPLEDWRTLKLDLAKTRNLQEAMDSRSVVVILDTNEYPGWRNLPRLADIRSLLTVPVISRGTVLGFLNIASQRPGTFSAADGERLRAFADQAAIAIQNARLYEDIQALALTDSLTGLHNRRGLEKFGEREVERALRFGRPLSIVMLDLDNFKTINDTYGHAAGDRLLCAVVNACRVQVRTVDILARYGGDEFVFLLPETSLEEAAQVAERLRQVIGRVALDVFPKDGGPQVTIGVSASLGVMKMTPEVTDFGNLLDLVDVALYDAKSTGRDRVAILSYMV